MFKFIAKHKFITFLVIGGLAVGGYYAYKAANQAPAVTKYVLGEVTRGTIVASVSGTGQVAVSDQVDIKPKASGDLTAVNIKLGQEVQTGDIVARIDPTDAQKAVRDAQTNLESAQLSLEKLKEPVDALSITQAENALTRAQESKTQTEESLKKSYDDGYNVVADAFLKLPSIMSGLHDLLFSSSLNPGQANIDYYADAVSRYDEAVNAYRDDAQTRYDAARQAYDINFADYKTTTRFSDTSVVENLINETYGADLLISDAIKSANNLIQFYQDKLTIRSMRPDPGSDSHLSDLSSYAGQINSQLSGLFSARNSIKNYKDSLVDADRTIAEKQGSLDKLKEPPDALDIRSAELTIQQRRETLQDARSALADYTVYAPFGGIIAKVNVKKGDSVSNATALATLITKQRIANISLNEIDAAKIKVGQKATLSFDAVEGLSITGDVSQLDTLGSVSQGVVSYNIEVGFDTQDDRVKPGMSLSASIIIDAKTDVLTVPNTAVKTNGSGSYVEMLNDPVPANSNTNSAASANTYTSATAPRQQPVMTGLSDDSSTEIVSGLNEGDKVVTSTIKPTSTTSTSGTSSTQNRSVFSIPGIGGPPGGAAHRD